MCMSPSSLATCTIYSTWCIMICLVILILSLLLFIQSLSKLQICSFTCLLFFLLLLVIALDMEYIIIIYYWDRSILPRSITFTVPLHVLQPAPVLMHVHLPSCLGLMTSEPKGLTKKSYRAENLHVFLSSAPVLMCIDFVAMTCIIMYCRLICISELKGKL